MAPLFALSSLVALGRTYGTARSAPIITSSIWALAIDVDRARSLTRAAACAIDTEPKDALRRAVSIDRLEV